MYNIVTRAGEDKKRGEERLKCRHSPPDPAPSLNKTIYKHTFFDINGRFSPDNCQLFKIVVACSSQGIGQSIFEKKLQDLYSKYCVVLCVLLVALD